MKIPANANQNNAAAQFYCSACMVLHHQSDFGSFAVCYYCDRPLCPMLDFSCVSCTRETCDNCCQACQEDDCDVITCVRCVETHLQTGHPLDYPNFSLDLAFCG